MRGRKIESVLPAQTRRAWRTLMRSAKDNVFQQNTRAYLFLLIHCLNQQLCQTGKRVRVSTAYLDSVIRFKGYELNKLNYSLKAS